MSKVVISDTSCFIAFDRINQIELLHKIFDSVLTTHNVLKEFGKNLPPWVIIAEPANQSKQVELEGILDKGEASAIALALEIKNSLIIIDEKKGRRIAKSLDLEVIGSLKVLLIAKQKGIIKAIYPLIQELESQNFRFSKVLVEQALIEADETI
jgi:predicted nucleic acid-binding protein